MNLHPEMPAAVISDCGQYRYFLSRRLGFSDRVVTFIGLNPSIADATQDDPTIRRCIGFAKRRDAGMLLMVNLFALRSTDPSALRMHPAPIGPENDLWIERAMSAADIAIAAWGNGGVLLDRSNVVSTHYKGRLEAFAITNAKMPKHPLYVRSDAQTISFET
nr:DUF1643 domain-containing protein [uncultured Rhodoferax sp.]